MVKRLAVLLALGAVFITGCYFRPGYGHAGRDYGEGTYSHDDERQDREAEERRRRDREAEEQRQRDREDEERREGSHRGGLFDWR
jgi:hypothetical protein